MAGALNEPTPLWCTCERPLPVHIAERKGAARSVCARCERPLRSDAPHRELADRERDSHISGDVARAGLDRRRRTLREGHRAVVHRLRGGALLHDGRDRDRRRSRLHGRARAPSHARSRRPARAPCGRARPRPTASATGRRPCSAPAPTAASTSCARARDVGLRRHRVLRAVARHLALLVGLREQRDLLRLQVVAARLLERGDDGVHRLRIGLERSCGGRRRRCARRRKPSPRPGRR